MPRSPRRRSLLLAALALAVGCSSALNVNAFPSNEALFTAGVERFEAGRYGDAITAFERLTFNLPSRDTLLPRSHWYLGMARRANNERLLAAQAFVRLAEQHPTDTLADDGLYWAAMSYREMWRRPSLDPEYGNLAKAQFELLRGIYPESPLADSAQRELLELDEWLATKDFETARYYQRRRAYDSAILYFKDVVQNFPNTDRARQSMVELVRIYRLPFMNYAQDAEEVCGALRAGFPTDPAVLEVCKMPTDSSALAGTR